VPHERPAAHAHTRSGARHSLASRRRLQHRSCSAHERRS
jgi:hypothetical protein